MPFLWHYALKVGNFHLETMKRFGYHHEYYLHKYKPNPFWSAEENHRFRHLGNLERFGKWRPPGTFKSQMSWTSYGTVFHDKERFQYENRPSPKDTIRSVEEFRWKATNSFRPYNQLMYGLGAGVAVYIGYVVCKKMLTSGKKSSDDPEHHH
eukprot:scpid63919/ scgid6412/ 